MGVAPAEHAEDYLPLVPVTLPVMYFVIVVVMFHLLVNQVSINALISISVIIIIIMLLLLYTILPLI